MFGSLFGIVGDVGKIALAPIAIASDVARVITKPVADLTHEVSEEVCDCVKSVIG